MKTLVTIAIAALISACSEGAETPAWSKNDRALLTERCLKNEIRIGHADEPNTPALCDCFVPAAEEFFSSLAAFTFAANTGKGISKEFEERTTKCPGVRP
jgi:hypothetical protein